MTWHVLDVGSVWLKEFTSALSSLVHTTGWLPVMSWSGMTQTWEREERMGNPAFPVRLFPLQRGYSDFPISLIHDFAEPQVERMIRQSDVPAESPLICTTPYYAPVAERWKGPVIYYQTDLTVAYAGVKPATVRALDRRMCKAAAAVCPNSLRIAEYMVDEAGCDASKIDIVPNATRAENILASAPSGPGRLPSDLSDLPRPIAGVLGNLAANLDWELLLEAVERTPGYSWAFVGPTDMEVPESAQQQARARLMRWGGRVRFTGSKPYAALQSYARCVDAAVLPYRRKEPTFSGSSTRFYEHLAACRPMLSTRGFEELLHKEPLLRLVNDARQIATGLQELAAQNFADGVEEARWRASTVGTWDVRAKTVIRALATRAPGRMTVPQLDFRDVETATGPPFAKLRRSGRFTLI